MKISVHYQYLPEGHAYPSAPVITTSRLRTSPGSICRFLWRRHRFAHECGNHSLPQGAPMHFGYNGKDGCTSRLWLATSPS